MRTFRYYEYTEDGNLVVTKTEEEIIAEYYPWWSEQMINIGKGDIISKELCITDWITCHWAEQINKLSL